MVIPTEPIWVDDKATLDSLCASWMQQAAIAIDTEFMRSSTYYPHAGLIQVGDGKGCYLIDPLAIDDLSSLAVLMTHPATVKVIHSCSEDLEVFRFLLGVVPSPLMDTQIAAAYANMGFSLGYPALINDQLGIALDKGETRSDWMQRPLSQSQLHYAALDVAYLLIVYGKILVALKALGRLEWVREECAILVDAANSEDDYSEAYTKIKLAWKLFPDQLVVLKSICAWRETQARQSDVPRNRLMKENAAWDVARKKPTSPKQLAMIDGMGHRTLKEHCDEVLALVAQAAASPAESHPPRLPKPLTPAQGDILKALKAIAQDVAQTQVIASEIIVRKKDLEQLTRSVLAGEVVLPASLQGWRYNVVGKYMEEKAQELAAQINRESPI